VYRFKNSYSRIYWVSAETQAFLLDGYRKIADLVVIQISSAVNAVEIAEKVITWLESEGNWLLVVDNLDDLKTLSTTNEPNGKAILLPRLGKQNQHTLITTRSRYADGIPATSKEVNKFSSEESLRLLYELSRLQ
jgi:hypothetical protein